MILDDKGRARLALREALKPVLYKASAAEARIIRRAIYEVAKVNDNKQRRIEGAVYAAFMDALPRGVI